MGVRRWVSGLATASMLGGAMPVSAWAGPPVGDEASAPVQTPGDDDEKEAVDAETPAESGDTPAEATQNSEGQDVGELADKRRQVRVEEAERHFVEGRALFNRGRYLEAAAEFERSYAAIEAAETLYNIALSYEKGGQAIPAIEASQRYLALPDCDAAGAERLTCARKRKEVERNIERLRQFVGELHLELAPGVELREVRVGGRVVPLEDFPVLLMPGPIEVELYGVGPNDQRVRTARISGGEPYHLRVLPFDRQESVGAGLTEPVPEDPDPPGRVDEERRQLALKWTFWAGVGLTAAGGVATGVLGGLTLREKSRYSEMKCGGPGEPPCELGVDTHPFESEDRFYTLRTTTNVMIGVTAALGVATAVVGIFALTGRQARGSTQRASTRVRLTGNGLVVRW